MAKVPEGRKPIPNEWFVRGAMKSGYSASMNASINRTAAPVKAYVG